MKTIKRITIVSLLLLSINTTQAQQEGIENSESVIIMSEDDIISLAKTLREQRKKKYSSGILNTQEAATIQKLDLGKGSYEIDYLRSQIFQLESQLKGLTNSKTVTNPSSAYDLNSLNRRELNNMKYEISQLKNLIQQLANKTNNDLTFVVPVTQVETKTDIPTKEHIIREPISPSSQDNIALKNKLDSLNLLIKNLKPNDNPDYSGDFNALENRISELKKDISLKSTQPNSYEALFSEYKGYSRSIYFSNNSIVLKIEGNQVVEELYQILDKNDNIDIVVKGFASNKGNALYNENLSMQRTESVKKALILRGIHPTRVLTQYHGIDYNAGSDKARRVEISILVRK